MLETVSLWVEQSHQFSEGVHVAPAHAASNQFHSINTVNITGRTAGSASLVVAVFFSL